MPPRPLPLLVATPALALANNGNWRTAARWTRLLAPQWRARVVHAADPSVAAPGPALLIALHARRSRPAIVRWKASGRPLVVALTGTDLYRDLPRGDADALASLADADRLVVLQDDALAHLPPQARAKARVVRQSARALPPWAGKSPHALDALLVAHLREEKDPATLLAAWRLLPADLPATLTVIGAALDPALGAALAALAASDARVRWLGPRPHAWTRAAIRRAHLVVVPSRMEGGANVIVEAITAGTPVLASRISGNVGMLGEAYAGYVPAGDARALAVALAALHEDRARLHALGVQCAARAPLHTPAAERRALRAVVAEALGGHAGRIPG